MSNSLLATGVFGEVAMAEDGSSGAARVISLGGADASKKTAINDHQFIRDLNQLKELRSFLIREAATISRYPIRVRCH
jgi:hypothetical protein